MRTYAGFFVVGALGYGLLEIAWRGSTHWSMLILGGVCLMGLYRLSLCALPLLMQCVLGALGITLLELGTGLVCNRMLAMNVWDYSGEWGNFCGQICPRYTLLWFLLCLPIFAVLRICKASHGVVK